MRYIENIHSVIGAANASVSSLSEDAVTMANYDRLVVEIILTISSGTDTGAVTLLQATDTAASGEKALSFDEYWLNHTVASNDLLTKTTATSNTFNAGGAAETRAYYIEVLADELDVTNDFDCVRVNLANVTNGTATIIYHLYRGDVKGNQTSLPSAL